MVPDPQRVRTVFLAVADHPETADRAAILDTACAGDLELRRRVEVLLDEYDRSRETADSAGAGRSPDALQPGETSGSEPELTYVYDGEAITNRRTDRVLPVIRGYEVLGELGRGGMGVVYRARQIQLNRPCVLKMILAGLHADAAATRRFLAEAEAVARLQHPNIVQIRNIGETEGLPYFELEYLEGGSLDRRVDGTPWPAPRAAALVEALARGVAAAHSAGIIHRDLKPANVLLAADGTPKVTDFGLAKELGSDAGLTRTDSILGSPRYMSPEQAKGSSRLVGPSADIYSLGAILYELLTGRPPFVGTTILEILEQVETIEPLPPARLIPGLSRDVETIALKCLQKEPAQRYESAAALAEDLRRFVAGEPIFARPVPFWDRFWRWCRRHPIPASLTAALFLVATIGLAGILWQWEEALKASDLASRRAVSEAAARREAESSLALARKAVDDSFTRVSESNLLNVPGMRPLRRDLLESALAFYEEFVRRDDSEPGLLAELAATQARIGLIYSELGDRDKARGALERAADLYEKTLTIQPDDVALLERLSEVQHRLGDVDSLYVPQADAAHRNGAQAAYQKAVAIRERLAAEQPGEPRFRMALSRSWNGIGLVTTGDVQRDALTRALALRLDLAAEIADDPDLLHGLNESFQNLFILLWGGGHREEALELARRSIEYGRASLAHRPHDYEFAFDLNLAYGKAGDTCWTLGYRDEALAILIEWLAFLRKLCGENPEVAAYRNELATTLGAHAGWLVELNQRPEAAAWLREAAELLAADSAPNGANLATAATYRARAALALAGNDSGQPIESWPEAARIEADLAIEDLTRAVALGFRGSDVVRKNPGFRPLLDRSDLQALLGEMEHPTSTVASAATAPKAAPARHSSPLDQPGRLEEDRILGELAIALVEGEKGDPGLYTDRLRAILRRVDAHVKSEKASPDLERTLEATRLEVCRSYLKTGRLAEAQDLLSRLPDEPRNERQLLVRRAALFESAGLPDRAEAHWTRALAGAPDDLAMHRMVAAAQSRRGRWDLAAETLAPLVVRNPENHGSWFLAVVVAARAGDPERWQRLCRPMLDRFQETDHAEIAERTAKCCLLLPTFGPEQEAAGRLAERAVEMATGGVTPWALNARGLAFYRSGNFAGALASAEASLAAFGSGAPRDFQAPAHCVRAMALVRLGRIEAARAALDAVSEPGPPATEPDPGQGWIDPLISEILYREADTLVRPPPEVPADPSTR